VPDLPPSRPCTGTLPSGRPCGRPVWTGATCGACAPVQAPESRADGQGVDRCAPGAENAAGDVLAPGTGIP
jgi:hypothetical protein